jgi:hypothetical protein
LLAPRLTDKIDPIRNTPKTIGDFASRRARQQNQLLKLTGARRQTTKVNVEVNTWSAAQAEFTGRRTPCLVEGGRTARLDPRDDTHARLEARVDLLACSAGAPGEPRDCQKQYRWVHDEDITTPPASFKARTPNYFVTR